MQLLQQIIPPKSNASSSCHHSASVGPYDSRYLVYACDNEVQILSVDNNLSLVQTLKGEETQVTAVAICENEGTIAVAFDETIHLYSFSKNHSASESEASLHIWSFETDFVLESTVKCLAWSQNGKLLAAGLDLTIFGKEISAGLSSSLEDQQPDSRDTAAWSNKWTIRLAREVVRAQFSPDGKFFATIAEFDSLVKIWYISMNEISATTPCDSWNFLYLKHPRAVLTLEWRSIPRNAYNYDIQPNVLLTTCKDNVCRLWCETIKPDEPHSSISTNIYALHKFELNAVIDPAEFPADTVTDIMPKPDPFDPIVSFTPSISDSVDSPSFADSIKPGLVEKRPLCLLHFLNSRELFKSIESREKAELEFLNKRKNSSASSIASLSARRNKYLLDTFKKYPDILFHVNEEGSIVFWGIQHLFSTPAQSAKVRVIMKTLKAVSPTDCDSLMGNNIMIWHNQSTVKKSAIYFPSKLQILAHEPDPRGTTLKLFSMNVDDFFGPSFSNSSGEDAACLVRLNSWCGHQHQIFGVQKSASNWIGNVGKWRGESDELLSSIDTCGDLIVWKVNEAKISLEATSALSEFANIPVNVTKNTLVNWLPIGKKLLVYSGKDITLWDVHGAKGRASGPNGATALSKLKGYQKDYPLMFLHSYIPGSVDFGAAASPGPADDCRATVFVIGVSAVERTVFLWALHFVNGSCHSHNLVSKSSLPSKTSSEIVKIASTDDLTTKLYPALLKNACDELKDFIMESFETSHLFLTFESDKQVRVWYWKESNWSTVAEFSLGNEPSESVVLLKTDPFGKMVVVKQFSPVSFELSIWGNESTGLEMTKDWSLKLEEPVRDAEWYLSSDGQHLLVFATVGRVYVYCQERALRAEDESKWVCISDLVLLWIDEVSCVSWLRNGNIVVTTGSSIRVYEKWMRKYDDDGMDFNPPSNIYNVASKVNGRLPDHHPRLLTQYLLWGQYDIAKHLLFLLFRFVKLTLEAKGTFADVPVPLLKLLEEGDGKNAPTTAYGQYDQLFEHSFGEDEEEALLNSKEFNHAHAAYLSEQLTRISLPHISGVDQMNLLALIDTFLQIDKQKRSLDENGVRYLLAVRIYIFSNRSFPNLKVPELQSRDVAWAFYSDSQNDLLSICNTAYDNKLTWKTAKAMGIGYWLRSSDALKRTVESIARAQFMENDERDPIKCSIFYMALRKKSVLHGLWKLANGHPEQQTMIRFLGNDFNSEKWKTAALKNAFALLGKQRFEYAVAFFLLADKLNDAVSVCLKQLEDCQLALVICRIFEGDDGPTLKSVLEEQVVPKAVKDGDRWLLSIAFSMLKKKPEALYATLMPFETLYNDTTLQSCEGDFTDPSLVILYQHLRKSYKSLRMDQPYVGLNHEVDFIYRSATAYERIGCPALALTIISKSPISTLKAVLKGPDYQSPRQSSYKKQPTGTDQMDWSQPVASQPATASSMDWGEPVSSQGNTSGVINWGEPVSSQTNTSSGIDWGEPVSSQVNTSGGIDWGEPVSTQSNAHGGIDWGEPTSTGSAVDDDYEAFKRSLQIESTTTEDELLDGEPVEAPPVEETVASDSVVYVDELTLARFKVQKKYIFLYKWQLAMKMIQAIFNSTGVVSKHYEVLKNDELFKDYFEEVRKGIRLLCEKVSMPVSVMHKFLEQRCMEMDAIIVCVEILPLDSSDEDETVAFLAKFLDNISNALSRIPFAFDKKWDTKQGDMKFLDVLSRRILWALVRWQEKHPSTQAKLAKVAPMTSANAFIVLTLSLMNQAKYDSLWWMVAFCDRFFEIISDTPDAVDWLSMIKEIIEDRPIVSPDEEHEDSESDEDLILDPDELDRVQMMKGPGMAETCELFISIMAFMNVGLQFEAYLRHLRDAGVHTVEDSSRILLCDRMMKNISRSIYEMQKNLEDKWEQYGPIDPDHLPVLTKQHSLKRILTLFSTNLEQMAQLAVPQNAKKIERKTSSTVKKEKNTYKTIYRMSDIIGSFAVNPLDHNIVAIASFKGIIEVDTVTAMKHYERKGSFSDKRRQSRDDLHLKPSQSPVAEAPALQQSRSQGFPHSVSYDQLSKASGSTQKRQGGAQTPTKLHKLGFSTHEVDIGEKLKRPMEAITCLEAHPSRNEYLCAVNDQNTHDCTVKLYRFGESSELVSYYTGSTGRISRIRFDPFGSRFGACDTKGDLFLWKFDGGPGSLAPFKSLTCHSSLCHDFVFLQSSTVLATAGLSMSFNNVCIWDTLLPPSKAKVKSFPVNEAGAYSIAHSPRHNLIFSGGKRGDISLIDVRLKQCILTFQAHPKTIKSMAIDEESGTLVTGSTDGQLKIWDIAATLAIIPTAAASPTTFNTNLISRTLDPPNDLKTNHPSIIQISNMSNGTVIHGDTSGLRRSQPFGKS